MSLCITPLYLRQRLAMRLTPFLCVEAMSRSGIGLSPGTGLTAKSPQIVGTVLAAGRPRLVPGNVARQDRRSLLSDSLIRSLGRVSCGGSRDRCGRVSLRKHLPEEARTPGWLLL